TTRPATASSTRATSRSASCRRRSTRSGSRGTCSAPSCAARSSRSCRRCAPRGSTRWRPCAMNEEDEAAPALRACEVKRGFVSAGHTLPILRGVELEVARGESVAIVGRSGGGKSTLLHLLGLLDRPTAGTIAVCGVETTEASRSVRDRLRRERIGFVFQFYHLLPELTAEQN